MRRAGGPSVGQYWINNEVPEIGVMILKPAFTIIMTFYPRYQSPGFRKIDIYGTRNLSELFVAS